MFIQYAVSREHRARYEARRNPPDNGESEGYAALRRMADPHGRLPFWSDFDNVSQEDFLGYFPGDK